LGVNDLTLAPRVHDTEIKNASNTIVMGDGIYHNSHYEYESNGLGKVTQVGDYHEGGANFLWIDGHVSHLHKSELKDEHLDRRF